MSNCYQCAYHANIPGDRHISCRFDWKKKNISPPKANEYGIAQGWYIFPLNFDPIWQEEECKAFSVEVDKDYYVSKFNPFLELLSLLK